MLDHQLLEMGHTDLLVTAPYRDSPTPVITLKLDVHA
jgi:hypothetical protein